MSNVLASFILVIILIFVIFKGGEFWVAVQIFSTNLVSALREERFDILAFKEDFYT